MKQEFRIAILLTILGLLIVWAHPVQASVFYQDSNVRVTLVKEPCANPAVLAQIVPQSQSLFLSGRVVWQGQDIGMCWTLLNDGNVFIVDETGDSGVIPANLFKRLTGV